MSENTAIATAPEGGSPLVRTRRQESAKPEENQFTSVPYVGFRGQKSNKYVEVLNEADIKVAKDGSGTFYLMDVSPVKVDPFKIHLLDYFRIFTAVDDAGKVIDATYQKEDGFLETLYAVVAVVLSPGNYVPATLQLRSAQCNALTKSKIITAYDGFAQTPEATAARGKQWEPGSKVAFPGGRFRGTIWSNAELPQGGGSNKFNNGGGSVSPTPADEVEKLNAWAAKALPQITAVFKEHDRRIDEVVGFANKNKAPVVKQITDGKTDDPIPF